MKSGVPWHIEGVRWQVRETAREAAQRAGMSVGEWLDSLILDSALHDEVEPGPPRGSQPQSYELGNSVRHEPSGAPRAEVRSRDALDSEIDREFADLKDRLDRLTRQLGRIPQSNSAGQKFRADDRPICERLDGTSNPDRRLDHAIREPGVSTSDCAADDRDRDRIARRSKAPTPLEQALMEIAARQRELDHDARVSPAKAIPPAGLSDPLPRAHTQELAGLEQQLRQINDRIETFGRPCGLDDAINTLRKDLAEIGRMLQEAMPRNSIAALEGEMRKLAGRIDDSRQSGADAAVLTGIERGLAEVRDALRELTPAEHLVGVDRAIQQLTKKIDRLASNAQDPSALHQLEAAILAMRGIVSHVASNDALAALAEEVRELTRRVEQAASSGGASVLSALEERIAALADALETRNKRAPGQYYELETMVKGLTDQVERIQLTRGDHAALGHLEDRIAKLVEKLDVSDVRIHHLEAIERGLAELLLQFEHQRSPAAAQSAAPPAGEMDALSRDIADLRQTERDAQDTLELVHATLGQIADRLASIESEMRNKPALSQDLATSLRVASLAPATQDRSTSAVSPIAGSAAGKLAALDPVYKMEAAVGAEIGELGEMAPAQPRRLGGLGVAERRPLDPDLPPDHPLEPGYGTARALNSPADRIAASKAALGELKPPVIPDPGGKSNFIAAARRAAQAAERQGGSTNSPTLTGESVSAAGQHPNRAGMLRGLVGGIVAIVLVLGSLHVARILSNSPQEGKTGALGAPHQADAAATIADRGPVADPEPPASLAPAAPPSLPAPAAARDTSLLPAPEDVTAGIAEPVANEPVPLLIPTLKVTNGVVGTHGETTRSDMQADVPASSAASSRRAVPSPVGPSATAPSDTDKLPSAFGSVLRIAAAKGDPAAQYEIAQRYADGRGTSQDLTEAANWFERAARQGLVPAQFRLGGLYEKGLGVKKNLETARRFYEAAGQAGHGKAMHNLAVLYAEGIDGKPDYPTAAKWFRKAAEFGIADSQYNLGVLHSRGIGVEQNFVQAYKWFALAAREGDEESARKRDDLARRLDRQSLANAAQEVETWRAEPQPQSAVQVDTPPGGWDASTPAAATAAGKRKPISLLPQLDLATPHSAQ